MDDGGIQYWQQYGQQQAEREARMIERLANQLVPFKVACELIMSADITDLEQARQQVRWAMDKAKEAA